jgi:hypothetical protein
MMFGRKLIIERPEPGVYEIVFDDGRKLTIPFQRKAEPTVELNGVSMEALLTVLAARLEEHQAGPWPCDENARALAHVDMALQALAARTERVNREAGNPEGTDEEIPY